MTKSFYAVTKILSGSSHLLLGSLTLVKPALSTSVNPEALLANAMLVKIVADTALLSAIPAAFVLSAVTPDKFTFSVAFIFLELANVLFAIGPN